jgi:hypothetical protein
MRAIGPADGPKSSRLCPMLRPGKLFLERSSTAMAVEASAAMAVELFMISSSVVYSASGFLNERGKLPMPRSQLR